MTPGGTILGSYFDSNGAIHGFLRTFDGNFTTFDVPNAAVSFFEGTMPTFINNSGTVTGFYFDTTQNSKLRVFLRASNGTFVSFLRSANGSISAVSDPVTVQETGANAINPAGTIIGFYLDENLMAHAFVRTPK